MKQRIWIFLFAFFLGANIAAAGNSVVEYITKPLIIISLALYFITQTSNVASHLKKWILLALFFSWTGDVLLLFQKDDSNFFLLGLSAFLLAHIFYIIFFDRIRMIEKIKGKWWLVIIVAIYYFALITILSPHLGNMKLPVRIYGLVISFMLILALHMAFIKNKVAGNLMMIGALLFVISDSILAINKFYQPFEIAGPLIMISYGFAQFFIISGASRYMISVHKE